MSMMELGGEPLYDIMVIIINITKLILIDPVFIIFKDMNNQQ